MAHIRSQWHYLALNGVRRGVQAFPLQQWVFELCFSFTR